MKTGLFSQAPFAENRDRQNPERGQSHQQAKNPARRLWRKTFEKCD